MADGVKTGGLLLANLQGALGFEKPTPDFPLRGGTIVWLCLLVTKSIYDPVRCCALLRCLGFLPFRRSTAPLAIFSAPLRLVMASLKAGFGLKSFLVFIQLVLVVALPSTSRLLYRAAPQTPSSDPFYTPPAGFESSAPGTILRSRNVPSPLAFLSIAPINIKGAYQLLYRTTDSLGNPEATVTTVIVPYNADPKKLLSYQFAEDGAWVNCAPSYVLQQGSNIISGGTSPAELLLVIAALNQ